MMRPTIFGSLIGVLLSGGTIGNLMFQRDAAPPAPSENTQLSESLTLLSDTLVSFETRQTGSEIRLTEQLDALAVRVAQTQAASQSQIDALAQTLSEVKQVAMQPADTSAFQGLLDNFGKDLEKRMDEKVQTMVKAEVDEALPAAGVGTLDVNSGPAADDGRPTDFADAAKRIVELEKEVAALKARSQVASPTPQYPPASGGVANGGSSGGTSSYVLNQPIEYSYPAQSYSQPAQVQAPQQQCKWRLIRGRWYCVQ